MQTETDHRQYPRIPVLFNAKYTIRSETFRDSVGNLSAGGIYINSRQPVTPGQRIDLRFPILAFDRRPGVAGMVVRRDDNGFAVAFDHPIEERFPDR